MAMKLQYVQTAKEDGGSGLIVMKMSLSHFFLLLQLVLFWADESGKWNPASLL
jgi:hypothetical protein